jgi:hypothetical protein
LVVIVDVPVELILEVIVELAVADPVELPVELAVPDALVLAVLLIELVTVDDTELDPVADTVELPVLLPVDVSVVVGDVTSQPYHLPVYCFLINVLIAPLYNVHSSRSSPLMSNRFDTQPTFNVGGANCRTSFSIDLTDGEVATHFAVLPTPNTYVSGVPSTWKQLIVLAAPCLLVQSVRPNKSFSTATCKLQLADPLTAIAYPVPSPLSQ